MTREIPLTQGQIALVDDEDFERVNVFKWQAQALYYGGYIATRWTCGSHQNRQTIYMHRFIMNTPKELVVDHINHNTLDNQKSNLRNCTRSQNQMNRRIHRNNKLGIKGIRKNGKAYQGFVWLNGEYVWCQTFPTIEEAIAARAEAVKSQKVSRRVWVY